MPQADTGADLGAEDTMAPLLMEFTLQQQTRKTFIKEHTKKCKTPTAVSGIKWHEGSAR